MLNFSPSCERNQAVILTELIPLLNARQTVLEVGSFSGQHAIHFSTNIPDIKWQPTDVEENISALSHNINEAKLSNCLTPLIIDVAQIEHWPATKYDIIFTANTLHIMSWQHVESFFENIINVCKKGTLLCIYGPFKYNGRYTSASNAEFQLWLQNRDLKSGIRDFERINKLAIQQGFESISDKKMPANNQLLTWKMV
jgi:cyclopropane fatty-acyl-phospholipid synthase-like methyltransferase